MEPVVEVPVDPQSARVYEHGWQSWSPSLAYALGEAPRRPVSERRRLLNYRGEVRAPADAWWGEGLLAVAPGDGSPTVVVAAKDAASSVPSIRGRPRDGVLELAADGPVEVVHDDGPGGLDGALARWADEMAPALGVTAIRPAPRLWCTWYQYFRDLRTESVIADVDALGPLELPIEVIQIDDGYQAEIGDWLAPSAGVPEPAALVGAIRERGWRAGIWTAPFLVGARSRTAAEHPDWLVRGDDGAPVLAGRNWEQDLWCLDTTHPGAEAWLRQVFAAFTRWGVDFHKLDFIFGGAREGRRHADVSGIEAYRRGLAIIRETIGPEPYLLGCGAPILPSIGLVDAMRVGPDTGPEYEPPDGDYSTPSSRTAAITSRGRAFMHGRFWVNDPDCLIVRPEVERREEWAEAATRWGGLRGVSDSFRALDDWGRMATRRFLETPPATRLIPS